MFDMRKILTIFIISFVIFAIPVFADDGGTGGIEDTMQYTNSFDNGFGGQKQITDEEFQKVLDQVKAKQNKRQNKKIKGKYFNDESSGGHINETSDKNILLSLPVALINNDGNEIPVGHYKIIGEKVKDKIYLDFYQSATLIAKVPAVETQSDFNELGINFVKVLPYNEKRVKIIFGSMEFNAYTFVQLEQPISDAN